jgi:hypothetical protein
MRNPSAARPTGKARGGFREELNPSYDPDVTALARIPLVGYDFGKKNTNAEKGELT